MATTVTGVTPRAASTIAGSVGTPGPVGPAADPTALNAATAAAANSATAAAASATAASGSVTASAGSAGAASTSATNAAGAAASASGFAISASGSAGAAALQAGNAGSSASAAAGSATAAGNSATAAAGSATSARTALTTLQNQKGIASGLAPLDASARLPAASYAIHPGQVLDAAATAFAGVSGASLGGFLASQVADASAGDGTYTAVYVYPIAPPNGRLWTMLFSYLTTGAPALSSTAAMGVLQSIWTAAASISP